MWCLFIIVLCLFFPSQRAPCLTESDTVIHAFPNWKCWSMSWEWKHVSKRWKHVKLTFWPTKTCLLLGKYQQQKVFQGNVLMKNHLVLLHRTSTLSGQVVHVRGDASFTSRAERYAQQHCAGLLWYGLGMCPSNGWQKTWNGTAFEDGIWLICGHIWIQNSDGFWGFIIFEENLFGRLPHYQIVFLQI